MPPKSYCKLCNGTGLAGSASGFCDCRAGAAARADGGGASSSLAAAGGGGVGGGGVGGGGVGGGGVGGGGVGGGGGEGAKFSISRSPPRAERKNNKHAGSGKKGLNFVKTRGEGRGEETSSVVSVAYKLWGKPDCCWICGLPFDYYYIITPNEYNKEKLLGDYAFTPNKEKLEESFWIKPSCNSTGQIIFDYSGPMPTGEHISQARIWEAICGFSFKVKDFGKYSPAKKLISKAGLRWSHHFCNMVKNDINLITFVSGENLPQPNLGRIENILNSIRSGRVRNHDGYQHHYDEPSCWTYSNIDKKIHLNFIRAILTTQEERNRWFDERRKAMFDTVNNLCQLLIGLKQIPKNKITILQRIKNYLSEKKDSWILNINDDFFPIEPNILYIHDKSIIKCDNTLPERFLSEKLDLQKWTDTHSTAFDKDSIVEALNKYKSEKIEESRSTGSEANYVDISEKFKKNDKKDFPEIRKRKLNQNPFTALNFNQNNTNEITNEITNEELASAELKNTNTLENITQKTEEITAKLPNNLNILGNIGAHLDALKIVALKLFNKSPKSQAEISLMQRINNSKQRLESTFNEVNRENRSRTRKRNQRKRKTRKN